MVQRGLAPLPLTHANLRLLSGGCSQWLGFDKVWFDGKGSATPKLVCPPSLLNVPTPQADT